VTSTLRSLLGTISRVTAPSGQIITLEQAKRQCRIDGTDDDAEISELIDEMTEFAETELDGSRQFLTATYDVPVCGFWYGELPIPRPPLASVTHIKYYDASTDTLTTLSSSYYLVRTPWRGPGTIELAPDYEWPDVYTDRTYPVTIRFVAGYGDIDDVPNAIKRAVRLLVKWQYEITTAIGGVPDTEPPIAAKRLLESVGYGWYA
jgi:uncharacterized phiE125 gp8 family phage protein